MLQHTEFEAGHPQSIDQENQGWALLTHAIFTIERSSFPPHASPLWSCPRNVRYARFSQDQKGWLTPAVHCSLWGRTLMQATEPKSSGRLLGSQRAAFYCGLVALSMALPSWGQANDPDHEEWITMFNGRDLSGWTPKITHHDLGENFANTFRVEDGLLKVRYDGYKSFDK